MRKRILATLLAVCLVLGMVPSFGYAYDTGDVGIETTISAGSSHSMVIDSDNVLWAWGDNSLGQLGNGTTDNALSPIKIMNDVKSVSAGKSHTAAIQTDGSLWIWGCNHKGELGNGISGNDEGYIWDSWGGDNYPIQTVPVKVMDGVSAVSCGNEYTAIIKTDGSLWLWGMNECGQIGNGTTEIVTQPVKVMDNVVAVSAGNLHTAALQADGTLWTWGNNDYFLDTDNYSLTPEKIIDQVITINEGFYNTAAIRSDGSLWMRGRITDDGLNVTTSDTMTRILSEVETVNLGYTHFSVIKPDSSLWLWGNGDYGRLGLESGTQSSPTGMSKSTMDDVVAVSVGRVHTIAVKSDGSVWTWGGPNDKGQLGNGSTNSSSVPNQVSGLTAKIPGSLNPKMITLSFDLDGGSGDFSDKSYNIGNQIILPTETPQKDGYIFTGWLWNSQTYQPGDTLTADNSDMTFVAQWAELCVVNILLNGGTDIVKDGETGKEEHALAPHARAVEKGSEFKIPDFVPTKEAAPFLGWTDGTNIYQPGDKFTVENSVRLTAMWTSGDVPAGAHSMTFDLSGGSAPAGWADTLYFTAGEGKNVRLPGGVPVKDEFDFAGWLYEGVTYQAGGQFPAVDGDAVLVAQWKSRFNRDELFTKSYSGNALKGAMCVPEGKNIDPALYTDFVSFLIGSSMGNTGSVQVAINQKIEKLLFSATYRPQSFGGIPDIIQGYPRQNKDFRKTYRDVEDIGLGRTFKSDEIGAWGCASYAHCVSLYVYETCGSSSEGAGIKVPEDQIQTTFRQHLDPGESIAYNYGNGGVHWIAFLGESEDKNGFYFLSYGGGIDTSVTDHKILLGYISYEDFASLAGDTISYWDTNGGSFYNKEIAEKKLDFNCPVEISVILGDESLSSKGIIGDVSSSFGRMTASGSSEDRHISVSLKPTTEDYYHVMVEGTGVGAMTLTLITIYTDGETDRRIYKNVPVSAATTMSTVLLDDGGTMDLCVDSGTNIQYWQTNFNGTAIEPSKGYYPYNPGLATPIQPNPPSSGQSGTSNPSTTTTPATYSIAIPEVTNGKVTASPSSAARGALVTLTATPDPGYELASLTVTDNKGNALELTDKGGGKYTFTMPGGNVEVAVVFQLLPAPEAPQTPWQNPYTDVAPDAWYCNAVQFVSENGLMTGTTGTEFSPDAPMTRAMLWTVLGRLDGADVSGTGNNWYASAQIWVAGKGISDGFNPGGSITREQLVTMLWRYVDNPVASADLTAFADGGKVSDWAAPAMQWAVSSGIIRGSGNALNPGGTATRAEVAVILMRFCENIAK